ncbi:Hpt domain-containing protein [Desulfovibrio oxyclinae]|jgi:HPt (histidine-containing phosphotransfer) domain-containing protein|uniref:Hpt domain-containing protein n=1 Tax=Desulfovibrio oxyclinae TaxID=63560 RepID=UPI00036EE780|nr:Hpt domain-containing protein [Desulfovibrio oxyclinae]
MLRKITQEYYIREFQLGPEDVDDLIQAAESTLRDSVAALSKCIAEDASEQSVREAAHALKGNLMNMGLEPQAEQARLIEAASGDLDEAAPLFEKLRQELGTF